MRSATLWPITTTGTGTDGQLTLENLKRLAERKKPVVIRTPLLPGINDTPEETAARERFLAGLDNILRWDRFYVTDHGRNKYAALGRKDWLAEYLRSQKSHVGKERCEPG